MIKKITAQQLYNKLSKINFANNKGCITFTLANVSVKINTTDTVGITLQAWVKQFMVDKNIFFIEPANTQEFPDFYLNDIERNRHMLEIKAFNYNATPAFDIANFESYCESVKNKPFRLDADYLIFGYTMETNGDITIKKIWLKKIWEIAGTSQLYPLKTQVKRGMIYNIRPNSEFKYDKSSPFSNKSQFLKAIYDTLCMYKKSSVANEWKATLISNYKKYYNNTLVF